MRTHTPPPPQPKNRNAAGRPSLRDKVDEFCRWCIYDEHAAGHWKAQVGACPSTDCPLWEVRPRLREKKK